jgi:hypothetical protein
MAKKSPAETHPDIAKQITDGILSIILANFKLDEKLINKIKEYRSKDQLQNEKGLERYIDKILTEKAINQKSIAL